MTDPVTQSEFASILGVSKQMVAKHKAAGLLVMEGKLVDVEASQRQIAAAAHPSYTHAAENGKTTNASIQPPAEKSHTEKATMSLQAARAVKENYNARMAKLEYEKASGQLVEAEEASRFAADLGATFRNALEILPDRLAAELVPLSDTDSIRAVLVEALENTLLDIAQKIEKGLDRAN